MATKKNLITSMQHPESNKIDTLIEALQQQNLVYNYNFLYFSNQYISSGKTYYNYPDGWVYKDTDTAGTIDLENNCCKITTTASSNMTFKQALHEFPRWESKLLGQKVTAKAHINLQKNNHVIVSLSDGIGTTSQQLKAQTDGDYVFELQLDININAKELYLSIDSKLGEAVLLISKVYANIGMIALETLPCVVKGIIGERKQYIATASPPAEELSLCEIAKELTKNQTRLNSVLNGRFGLGNNKLSLLPDVRGYFSRAWNNGSVNDPDAAKREMLGNLKKQGDLVGTREDDIFEKHLHDYYSTVTITIAQGASSIGLNTLTTGSKTKETGGLETRPINVAELYTIKWA